MTTTTIPIPPMTFFEAVASDPQELVLRETVNALARKAGQIHADYLLMVTRGRKEDKGAMDALRADLGIVDRTLHAAVRALDDYQATQRQQQAVKDGSWPDLTLPGRISGLRWPDLPSRSTAEFAVWPSNPSNKITLPYSCAQT